jgi:hypothetical protein
MKVKQTAVFTGAKCVAQAMRAIRDRKYFGIEPESVTASGLWEIGTTEFTPVQLSGASVELPLTRKDSITIAGTARALRFYALNESAIGLEYVIEGQEV